MESWDGTEAEALYEHHKPDPDRRMQAEILCMHCPQRFVARLKDRFPNVRILSSAYDSSAGKSETAGNLPGPMISMAGDIGQNYCPVVFVYCCNRLKRIFAMKIVVRCHSDITNTELDENFFRDMKTMNKLFHYSTPPHGSVRVSRKSLNPKATGGTRTERDFIAAVNGDDKFYVFARSGQSNVIPAFKTLAALIAHEPRSYARHMTEFKFQSQNDGEYMDMFTITWINVTDYIDRVIWEYKWRTPAHLSVVPIGIEGKIDELSKLLERPDVSIVGLTGRRGAGKTTLIKSVYNRTAFKYEKSCYLENCKSQEVEDVLKELLRRLCGKQLGKNECVEQKHLDMIKDSFRTQKVLVVLDEASSLCCVPLKKFFGVNEDVNWVGCHRVLQIFHAVESGSQSKVVVTCRSSAILPTEYLNSSKATIVPVNEIKDLKGSDLELFLQYVYRALGENDFDTELLSVVKKIAQLFDGLPLALVALGRYLGRQFKDIDPQLRKKFWADWYANLHARLQKEQDIDGNLPLTWLDGLEDFLWTNPIWD